MERLGVARHPDLLLEAPVSRHPELRVCSRTSLHGPDQPSDHAWVPHLDIDRSFLDHRGRESVGPSALPESDFEGTDRLGRRMVAVLDLCQAPTLPVRDRGRGNPLCPSAAQRAARTEAILWLTHLGSCA